MAFLSPASPDQLTEILDTTFPLWGEGLDRAGYERYNDAQRQTPWGARCLHRLVLAEGTRWLSTAKRYDLRGRLDGREVRIMGIGAVFTPPGLRRHGHAAELIRRMLDQAEGEGIDLALLFSEIGPRYYQRLGFSAVPLSQFALQFEPMAGPAGIALRSGEARDLAAVCEMNRLQAEGARFSIARDPVYAAYAIAKKRLLAAAGPPGRRQVEFFVVEEGSRAAAYLVLFEVGNYWMVTECGDRDASGARVGAMLQTLLSAPGRRPAAIRAWLPPAFLPPQTHAAVREVPPLTMMMRRIGRSGGIEPPLGAGDLAYWHADAF